MNVLSYFRNISKKEYFFYILFFSPMLKLSWVCYILLILFSLYNCFNINKKSIILGLALVFAFIKLIQIGDFTVWFALIRFFWGWLFVYYLVYKKALIVSVPRLAVIFSLEIIMEFILINTILPPSYLPNYPNLDDVSLVGFINRPYSVGSNASISGTILCIILAIYESMIKREIIRRDRMVDNLSLIAIILFLSGTTTYLYLIYLMYRFSLLRIKTIVCLISVIILLTIYVDNLSVDNDSILYHSSWDYIQFIFDYKQNQIENFLFDYKSMDSLFGYDYSKGEEPLTWGDFSIVEFYISLGIIGIILFFLFSFSKMNKTNFVAILIGLLGSLHYGGVFSISGQLVYSLALLLKNRNQNKKIQKIL